MGRKRIKNLPTFINIRITEGDHDYLYEDCKDPIFRSKPIYEILHRVLLNYDEMKESNDYYKTSYFNKLNQVQQLKTKIEKLELEIKKIKEENTKEEKEINIIELVKS
jgi:predicted RNase H-like nuclease (RuvC/YqgF family)